MANEVVIARTHADVTAAWLSRALGVSASCPVTSVQVCPVGTGQMGSLTRAELTFIGVPADDVPSRVIVKQAAESADVRGFCSAMGIYEREVHFYQEIAPLLGPVVPTCYLAAMEPDGEWFTLVLEDLTERATPVDASTRRVESAATALGELARLQTRLWNDPELLARPWLAPAGNEPFFAAAAAGTQPFLERFGDRLEDRHIALFERVLPRVPEWARTWAGPLTVSHGDFRWDNMMFSAADGGPDVVLVDWQAVKLGPPLLDVAFFLGSCLSTRERCAHERALVAHYHSTLRAFGVEDYSAEHCWREYRRNSIYGLVIAGLTVGATQTDRGDSIIARGARGAADFVLSLEAEELLE